MVGLCGIVGDPRPSVGPLVDAISRQPDDSVETYTDDDIAVGVVTHGSEASPQPAFAADGDTAVWVWGDIYGYDDGGDYTSRTRRTDAATYCAARYDEHGASFPEGLNGLFVGLLYDRSRGVATFFNDRLGTRPLYHVWTDDAFVFSTDIQSLSLHPDVETGFDPDYVAEYLACKRTFGVKTPLRGVESLHPASTTTVDPDDRQRTVEPYWQPRHRPIDRPRSEIVDELVELLPRIVEERTRGYDDCGLLLSGGSDSRLVLAATERPVTAYHLNEWENREAEVARRAAEATGNEFRLLVRDREYQERALDENAPLSNFVGYFNQAHANGFADTIVDEVDALLTGHYGDMLFKGAHLSGVGVDLGPLGSFDLPVADIPETLPEFVDWRTADAPPYLRSNPIRRIIADNVRVEDGSVIDHGVKYDSLRDAAIWSRYPLTNGTSQFFYYGTLQALPTTTPFLDVRLLDLALTIPIDDLVRGGIIDRAVARLSPELGDIPHASTGVPLKYGFPAQFLGTLCTGLYRRHFAADPPTPEATYGPWTSHDDLIRQYRFVGEALREAEPLVRALPFLDWDGVQDCYRAQLRGENNFGQLYTLATLLRMPVTERLADVRPTADAAAPPLDD